MEYRELGTRYIYNKHHSHTKYSSYDYEANGLLVRLLPKTVTSTNNTTTQIVLSYIDKIFISLLKYVDKLRYFKDWNRPEYL